MLATVFSDSGLVEETCAWAGKPAIRANFTERAIEKIATETGEFVNAIVQLLAAC
jgi:hypothetical protein